MKSLFKQTTLALGAVALLSLTACGGPSFDITLENGSDVIIQTDMTQLTNQELFEMLHTGNAGLNASSSVILDWADEQILSELTDVDEAQVATQMEMVRQDLSDEEFETLLMAHGFMSVEAYEAEVRLGLMRQQVIEDAVVIEDEEVVAAFNEWFGGDLTLDDIETRDETDASDELEDADIEGENDELEGEDSEEADETLENEDADDESDETDLDDDDADWSEEGDDSEGVAFEDVREDIEHWLRNERAEDPTFAQETLANLRYEAGLVIHSTYLTTNYENFLESWGAEANVNRSTNHQTAIATLGDETLTTNELFDRVITRFALANNSPVFTYLDVQILDQIFDVDHADVRDNINLAKRNLLDFFYPQMEMLGLTTEQQIFNHFLFQLLEEAAFDEIYQVDEDAVLELYENHVPQRNVYHILVESHDEATDIIAQLQEVRDDEHFMEHFSELAFEASLCDSSFSGGFLGNLGIPSGMVEPFENAAFALEEDTFSTTPVETEFGYHIIFANEFDAPLSLEQHRENELNRLRMNPVYFTRFMVEQREQHQLTFNNETLQQQYNAIVRHNLPDASGE